MALEDLSPVDFNARAKELSFLSRRMGPQAQYHLFWNKQITFNRNRGRDGRPGFNDWCETMAKYHKPKGDPESVVGAVMVTDPLSSLFGSIRYDGGGRRIKTEKPQDSHKYVGAFSRVTRLELSDLDFKYLPLIPDFGTLGSNIQTLIFRRCEMGVDQLVQYLLPFNNLRHLVIRHVNFIPINANVKNAVLRGPLPRFNGTLDLSVEANGRPLILALNAIPGMKHSRVIFRLGVVKSPRLELLNTFLSKFRDTLTHLRINGKPTLHISGVWLFGC